MAVVVGKLSPRRKPPKNAQNPPQTANTPHKKALLEDAHVQLRPGARYGLIGRWGGRV
jgi:hypothetical protein